MPRKAKSVVTPEELIDGNIYEDEKEEKPVTEELAPSVKNDAEMAAFVSTEPAPEPAPEFVTVYFEVGVVRPDSRQYRQQSIEFSVPYSVIRDDNHSVLVAVKVPNIPLYVISDTETATILTPAGWFYVQTELERPYLSMIEQAKEEQSKDTFDESSTEKKASKPADDDDDWGDDDNETDSKPAASKSKGDEKWDEDSDDEDW